MVKATGKGSKLYMTEKEDFFFEDVIANLTSIGEIGPETEEIESTDLDSGDYREFIPGMKDGGSIDISGHIVDIGGGYNRIKSVEKDNMTVDWGIAHPTLSNVNFRFRGFITSLKIGERTAEDLLTFTASIRVVGKMSEFLEPHEEN